MRRDSFVLLTMPCLLAWLASCGGPESHQTRVSPPASSATASTTAESELYRRALNEPELEVQVDLLVKSLRLGSIEAGARLIALGRWNEMALVDPHQAPIASWAESSERVGAMTRGQVHGVLLANWAIRNAALLEAHKQGKTYFSPLRREMVRALKQMWEGPLDDPMLLGELSWLISEYGESALEAKAFRLWLVPRILDDAESLDRHAMHARLVQFIYLVSRDSELEPICETACDKAVVLARVNGFSAAELALSVLRPLQLHMRLKKPLLNGGVLMPDERAKAIMRVQSLLDLSRRAGDAMYAIDFLQKLAHLKHPDRLRFDMAQAYPKASWQEVAKLYEEEAEAILSSSEKKGAARPPELQCLLPDGIVVLPPKTVHARALINQAWCLHQGTARDPQGVPQAIALYEKAIAQLDAELRGAQTPFFYSFPGAAITLRWLRDELTPNQFMLPMYEGIDVPDDEIFPQTKIYVRGMRVGLYQEHGIGEERGWWDETLERPAMSGSWKDGRRDGAWTWWHANGSLAVTGSFRAGIQIGRWRFLGPDGKLIVELDAGEGAFAGEFPIPDPDSAKRPGIPEQKSQEMVSDSPPPPPPRDGWQTLFYPDGRKKAAGLLSQGLARGEWTWWHEDGVTVEERAHMRMGIRDGEASIWGENGDLHSTGRWRCGLRDGDWIWFDYSGKKLKTATFFMGETLVERDE